MVSQPEERATEGPTRRGARRSHDGKGTKVWSGWSAPEASEFEAMVRKALAGHPLSSAGVHQKKEDL